MTTSTETPTNICVDMDGTLLATDTLMEALIRLLHSRPLALLLAPFWLLRGKANFKARVAAMVTLDVGNLPLTGELLGWLHEQRDAGATLWLCTGAPNGWAQSVADRLGIFSGVISSTDHVNLTGAKKADLLVQRFGDKGFTYCGNEPRDLQVWKHACRAVVVGHMRLSARAQEVCPQVVHIAPTGGNSNLLAWARELRLHQWSKNLLVFVPMLAAHRTLEGGAWGQALLAFASFCLAASSVYLLNDLVDLPADRAHPRKRARPLASGALSIAAAAWMVPVLLVASAVPCAFLPARFTAVLAGYVALTLAYSWLLKRFALVDTLTLATLYTMRLIAGASAVQVPLSFWLLAFSGFLFFSLALVKRSAELRLMQKGGATSAAGRGYQAGDLPLVDNMGIASGLLAVLVLALYLNSPDVRVLYAHPTILWGLCPLLVWWICRVWLLVHRDTMHDDPVVFALRDRASLIAACAGAGLVWMAT